MGGEFSSPPAIQGMNDFAPPDPIALQFVTELLRTGLSMTDALASLIESLEGREPWPGEENAEVLLDMAAGSVSPALRKVPPAEVERATALIAAAGERFLDDLRLAAEVSGRRASMRR
jgi:hypothetical protein